MAQQTVENNVQVRTAVLVFCRDMSSPMVLYFDNAEEIYQQVRALMDSSDIKVVEFEPIGPIKKATVSSDRIVGVALQEERYLVQQ